MLPLLLRLGIGCDVALNAATSIWRWWYASTIASFPTFADPRLAERIRLRKMASGP